LGRLRATGTATLGASEPKATDGRVGMWIEEGRRSTGGGLTVLVLADFIATEPVEGVACRSPFALSDSPTARQRDSHRFVSFRAWIQRS
jgi:hypothetical protein